MSTLSPTELYLQDFHQRVAGATSAAFAGFPAKTVSREYRSSYDVLASLALETPVPKTVLDVACGDGHLLRLLADSSRQLQLIGVDMSQGELDIARATLPDHVLLLKERAQEMSVATGSVDIVLSHMALMLMDEIEQVLREIHRVLAPGGTLAAMVGRKFLLGEVNKVFLEILIPIAKEDLPPLAFGDRRTGTIEGWTELLHADFDDLHFEDVDVPWNPTTHELWNSLVETYDIDRLSDDARHRLKERLLPALSQLQEADGTIRTGWAVRLVRARAR